MNDYIRRASNSLWETLENNQRRIRHLLGIDVIIERLAMITDIYMPAMVQHQKVFPKYKGINKGKTVVVVGTGPSSEYYTPISEAVHIGVNNIVFRKDIQFDYIFIADFDDRAEYFEKVLSDNLDSIKFFGINYVRKSALIPEYLRERKDVETYYIDGYNWTLYGAKMEKDRKFVYPLDLSVSPFKSYGTNMYCAFQFALWTHPDKIYIVGADCWGKSHASGLDYGETCGDYRVYIKPWRKLKEFAESYYPDIEIVSLNPVGLRGVFKDEYTDKYMETGSHR